jgi:transposase
MRRFRSPYPPEYREQLVALVRSGRSPESLAKEFEASAAIIRKWAQAAAREAGKPTDAVSANEREELKRLRREVAVLREEREILKKAAAWFAQESAKTRSGS